MSRSFDADLNVILDELEHIADRMRLIDVRLKSIDERLEIRSRLESDRGRSIPTAEQHGQR